MAFGEKLGLFFLGLKDSLKKNAPTIGVVGGVTAIVAGTGFACWATLKADKVVKETNEKIEANKKEIAEVKDEQKEIALVKENKKEIAKAVGKISLYYSPAFLLVVGGVASVCAAHVEQGKRLTKALATSSTLSMALARAQKALQDAAGAEAEENLRIGATGEKQKHLATHVDQETGEITTEEEELPITDPNLMGSPYAMYYDETTSLNFITNENLLRDDEIAINMKVLSGSQSFLENKMLAHGGSAGNLYRRPLMYHEILKELDMKYDGIPRYDKYGEIVKIDNAIVSVTGKIYDPNNPDLDQHLDLRARVVLKKVLREDGNWDYVKSIVIDPNLDGCVLDYKYRG